MERAEIQQMINDSLREAIRGQGGVIPYHIHNGIDAPFTFDHRNLSFLTQDDAATVQFDISIADIQSVTLGGNRTLAVTNAKVGDRFILRLIQDGTGSRTVTWFSTIHWAGGSAPTLTTTASHWDDFGFICVADNVFDGLIVGQNLS
jgi:hypothetical protein